MARGVLSTAVPSSVYGHPSAINPWTFYHSPRVQGLQQSSVLDACVKQSSGRQEVLEPSMENLELRSKRALSVDAASYNAMN